MAGTRQALTLARQATIIQLQAEGYDVFVPAELDKEYVIATRGEVRRVVRVAAIGKRALAPA